MFAFDSMREVSEQKKTEILEQEKDTVVSNLTRSCQKCPRNEENIRSDDTTRNTVMSPVVSNNTVEKQVEQQVVSAVVSIDTVGSVVVPDEVDRVWTHISHNSHSRTPILDLNLLMAHPKYAYLNTNHTEPVRVSSSHFHTLDTG
ncbi:hypothetical protein OROGR_017105 [Orobanche gracilis]